MCLKYLVKSKDVVWELMDFEKYIAELVGRGLLTVLRLYGLGGKLLKEV